MSKRPVFTLLAALLLAITGIAASHTSAEAAGTGCLPSSLKSKLAQIRQKFGPVRIVSAHRPGARIAGSGKRSYHASCRAVDFHAPSGKHSQVVAWLKSNHSGGVGTYSCGMHHIHIDNGPRVRFHHCVNASGKPVGKKRHYAKKSSKKQYAKKSYSKKRYAKKGYTKKQYAKKSTAKKYSQKSTKKRYSANTRKAKSQYADNGRWKVNNYAAF